MCIYNLYMYVNTYVICTFKDDTQGVSPIGGQNFPVKSTDRTKKD